MAIVISDAFAGPNGQTLQVHDPKWVKMTDEPEDLTLDGLGRISRFLDGQGAYRYDTAIFRDMTVSANLTNTTINPVGESYVIGRASPAASTYYAGGHRSGGTLDLLRVINNNVAQIGFFGTGGIAVGTRNITLAISGNNIQVYFAGVLRINVTDTLIPTGSYAGVRARQVSGTRLLISNYTVDGTLLPPLQNIVSIPAESKSKVSTPTWITENDIASIPVYSRSVVSVPLLIRETVALQFEPPFSCSFTTEPLLTGGAVERDLPSIYSEARVADVYLISGQGIHPQPAESQSITLTPVMIPGPVTRNAPVLEVRSKVRTPILSMALIMDSVPSFSQSKVRKPTLKSRHNCCTIAPLQDRARARVVQGGAGCGVGTQGSDGMVWNKW